MQTSDYSSPRKDTKKTICHGNEAYIVTLTVCLAVCLSVARGFKNHCSVLHVIWCFTTMQRNKWLGERHGWGLLWWKGCNDGHFTPVTPQDRHAKSWFKNFSHDRATCLNNKTWISRWWNMGKKKSLVSLSSFRRIFCGQKFRRHTFTLSVQFSYFRYHLCHLHYFGPSCFVLGYSTAAVDPYTASAPV